MLTNHIHKSLERFLKHRRHTGEMLMPPRVGGRRVSKFRSQKSRFGMKDGMKSCMFMLVVMVMGHSFFRFRERAISLVDRQGAKQLCAFLG